MVGDGLAVWSCWLDVVMSIISPVFGQARSRMAAFDYVAALLRAEGRRSCWQLAELAGHATPRRLQAGYLEDWEWNATLSGAPQGGVVSPILSNIYLDRLDKFVETVLIPEYTRGKLRRHNRQYRKVQYQLSQARRRGDRATARQLRRRLRELPVGDPHDPGYRRLRYIRYADDHLLGFVGPKVEAEQIKQRLAEFLREQLKLELSQDKTLITHARTGAARFLGYEITVHHNQHKLTAGRRSANGGIGLRVPRSVIKAKCAPYRLSEVSGGQGVLWSSWWWRTGYVGAG